jgi:arylsulfatase A-like enzyme
MAPSRFLDFTGWHAEDALLLAWRPGVIRRLGVVDLPARQVDIAPTVLRLLGWPPEAGAEGRPLTALLEPGR